MVECSTTNLLSANFCVNLGQAEMLRSWVRAYTRQEALFTEQFSWLVFNPFTLGDHLVGTTSCVELASLKIHVHPIAGKEIHV